MSSLWSLSLFIIWLFHRFAFFCSFKFSHPLNEVLDICCKVSGRCKSPVNRMHLKNAYSPISSKLSSKIISPYSWLHPANANFPIFCNCVEKCIFIFKFLHKKNALASISFSVSGKSDICVKEKHLLNASSPMNSNFSGSSTYFSSLQPEKVAVSILLRVELKIISFKCVHFPKALLPNVLSASGNLIFDFKPIQPKNALFPMLFIFSWSSRSLIFIQHAKVRSLIYSTFLGITILPDKFSHQRNAALSIFSNVAIICCSIFSITIPLFYKR